MAQQVRLLFLKEWLAQGAQALPRMVRGEDWVPRLEADRHSESRGQSLSSKKPPKSSSLVLAP